MLPTETPSKTKLLGKKLKQAEEAQNPDLETSMGALMALRAGMKSN